MPVWKLSPNECRTLDLSNPDELLRYAKKLVGHSFREVLMLGISPDDSPVKDYGNVKFKGGMGTLIEECYFGYKANSDEHPDFPDAGVELKATCYDIKKDGELSAGERLSITNIHYDERIEANLEDSGVWHKASLILLLYYERDRSIEKLDQKIKYVIMFTPSDVDWAIIKQDYELIRKMVMDGEADMLSESLTRYLGACTKGGTAAKSWVNQYRNPARQAKQRNFCFKRQYMDYVLHHYVMSEPEDSESIIDDASVLNELTFDEYVLSEINAHAGKTDKQLCEMLGMEYTGNKAQWVSITYKLLGLRGEHAQEFEKAGISVRTIRVKPHGGVKESLSLDTFDFIELLEEEDWEHSDLFTYFDETRFLFVVFQQVDDSMVLRGARFWSMPITDLEGPLHDVWDKTREVIAEGVELVPTRQKNGKIVVKNNLPGKQDNPVAHVRPHTGKSAYRFMDGSEIGDVERHASPLPDGRWMAKQSFWLNNDYVYGIVDLAEGDDSERG